VNFKCKHSGKFIAIFTSVLGDRGSSVVKVLRYKSEGRWFESPWYTVIHEIVTTKERPAAIHLTQTQNDATSAGKRIPSGTESQTGVKGPLYGIGRAQNRCTTSHGPPSHSRHLNYSPHIPLLPPPPHKGGSTRTDFSTSGGVSDAKEETPNTHRLHRFLRRVRWKDYQKSPRQHNVRKQPRYSLTAYLLTYLLHGAEPHRPAAMFNGLAQPVQYSEDELTGSVTTRLQMSMI